MPVKLIGVQYYLQPGFFSGGYTWSGDLIITSTTIYYFPVVDLEKQRKERRSKTPGGLIGFLIYDLPDLISKKETSFFVNLHSTAESDSEVMRRLDAFFENQKSGEDFLKSSLVEDRNDLPRPMRFRIDEISKLQLGRGKLSFNSVADTHDFAFSVRKTIQVKLGLETCGYKFD